MRNDIKTGWILTGAGIVMLIVMGRADWLPVLLPVSLLLGWGVSRAPNDKNPLLARTKKG